MDALRRFFWSRLDDVELCRRLTLAGWRRLVETEELGRGSVLAVDANGPWPLAVAAVGLYRGRVDVLVAGRREIRAIPAAWRRRFVAVTVPPDAAPKPSLEALERQGRVLVIEGAGVEESALAATWARESGAPRLALTVRGEARGRCRISIERRMARGADL